MLLFIRNIWDIMLELSPWLLFGTTAAGVLHIILPAGFIKKHLGGNKFINVFKAVVAGVPMPLCSCGVIPTAIGLKKEGAADGAATGFLISTPQTGVDSILVSASFLGWPFAVFKVFSALLSGVIGGLAVNIFDKGRVVEQADNDQCCRSKEKTEPEPPDRSVSELVSFALKLLQDIYRWLLIGIVVAAIISSYIPAGRLAQIPWTQGFSGMIAMLIISLPMYICATASVPLAASLITAGMSPGSALVLLMAGPATNVATVGAVYKAFDKRVISIYLITVAAGSVILGHLFDFALSDVEKINNHVHPLPDAVEISAAVILAGLLIYFAALDVCKLLKLKARTESPKS